MRIISGGNDRSVIVHPKIYQLVKSLAIFELEQLLTLFSKKSIRTIVQL